MSDVPYLEQHAYLTAFTLRQQFIANNFPLCENLTELIRRGIIQEKYRTQIATCSSFERGTCLKDCLLLAKDVTAFENFLSLCEEQDKKLAINIRQEISKQRSAAGLPPSAGNRC